MKTPEKELTSESTNLPRGADRYQPTNQPNDLLKPLKNLHAPSQIPTIHRARVLLVTFRDAILFADTLASARRVESQSDSWEIQVCTLVGGICIISASIGCLPLSQAAVLSHSKEVPACSLTPSENLDYLVLHPHVVM